MNKLFFSVLIFLFTSSFYANTFVKNSIKLPEHYKVLSTFSGEIDDTKSFHLIMTKNKLNKKFTVHPYIYEDGNITELKIFENKFQCKIVSFHTKDDILSLLVNFTMRGSQYLKLVNVDFIKNYISENKEESHLAFKASFKEKNKSILLYNSYDGLLIKQYLGPKKTTYLYNYNEKNVVWSFLKNKDIGTVKTNEFVKNGSIKDIKAYLLKKQILFSKEQKNSTKILSISLEDSIISVKKNKEFSNNLDPYKKVASYFYENKLFQLGLNKKEGNIIIRDINDDKILNTINLNSLLSIKGNPAFKGIQNFLTNARKKIPTITVNKTIDDNLRIRIDYVDAGYYYYDNMWWFHQQMQFHQQMMHNASGFGPRQPNEYIFENPVINKEKTFFELLVNDKGEIINKELPKTIYKNIDKEKYIDELKENKELTHKSNCFLKDSFRYFGYSKISKTFKIHTKSI